MSEESFKVGRGRRTNITGKRFGKLVVLSLQEGRSQGSKTWACLCDCGRTVITTTCQLTSGRVPCCGCTKYRKNQAVEEITGKYWGNLTASAKRRKIPVEITMLEAAILYEFQDRRCALSGVPIGFGTPITASLDRINSQESYRTENVQWVHKDVNYMKMDLGNQDFILWCNRVAAAHKVDTDSDEVILGTLSRMKLSAVGIDKVLATIKEHGMAEGAKKLNCSDRCVYSFLSSAGHNTKAPYEKLCESVGLEP